MIRLGKLLGAIGAGILGAGAIVLAGRTGVGKSEEDATDEVKTANDNDDVKCEETPEEVAAEEVQVEDAPAEE